MISLFTGIRSGAITRQACESQLKKFQAEKTDLVKQLARKALGRDLYDKKISELQFAISLLEYVILVYDDLKLPLKTPKKEKPELSDLSEFPPFLED